jgi:hypothetical protein
MDNSNERHHSHRGSESDGVQKEHRPYWTRAHKDWRFWLALILMIVAMGIYVMSEDLSMRPGSRPQEQVPASLGK